MGKLWNWFLVTWVGRPLVFIEKMIEFLILGIFVMPFATGKIWKYEQKWIYWTVLPWIILTVFKWTMFLMFFAFSAVFIAIYAVTRMEYFGKIASASDQTANACANGNMDYTFSGRLGVKKVEGKFSKVENRFAELLDYFDPNEGSHVLQAIEQDEKAVI